MKKSVIFYRLFNNMNLSTEQQMAMTRMIKRLAIEKKKFDGFD